LFLVWALVAFAPSVSHGSPLSIGRRVRLLVVASVAAALVVVPWLAYARATFDSLLPTSGISKLAGTRNYVENRWGVAWHSWRHVAMALRLWPEHAVYLWRAFAAPHSYWYLASSAIALCVGARALLRRAELAAWWARHSAEALVSAALVLWSVVNGVMVLFFLPQFALYGTWYAAPEALLFCVGFALATQVACTRRPRPLRAFSLCAALLVTALSVAPFYRGPYDKPSPQAREARGRLRELGLWAREHLPQDAVLGAWTSGIFTYFSERTVVSLEGLVNDLDFLLRGRLDLERYIEEAGIEYVFGPGRSHADGSYSLAYLRPERYDVEWLPYPEFSFDWQGLDAYLLIRPHSAKKPPRLTREDFPFGLWRPPTFRGTQEE